MAKNNKRKPSNPPPQRVGAMHGEKERREALDSLIRAFTTPQGIEAHITRSIWQGAMFKPEFVRVTVAEGRVVSAVAMAPRNIRFGPVTVPAMTVGPVGTHDHYRKKGYSSANMLETNEFMRDSGYLIAYLQGIPDYYYRFGYYPFAAPRNVVKIKRVDAAEAAAKGKLRKLVSKDLPAVQTIYKQVSGKRICTAERDDELWDWLLGPGGKTWLFKNPRVITDAGGDVCGYITSKDLDSLDVGEIVVRPDEESFRATLGALVVEAKQREVKELSLPLPFDDQLAVFLRQYVPCEFIQNTHPTGGALLQVIDFPKLMERIAPMFAGRWVQAHTALKGARFVLQTDDSSVGIEVDKTGVRIAKSRQGTKIHVPRRWLSGLLTGFYTFDDLRDREGVIAPAKLLPVLRVLFPPRRPFVYQADNY